MTTSSPPVQVPAEVYAGHLPSASERICAQCGAPWPCTFARGVQVGFAAAHTIPTPRSEPHTGDIDAAIEKATWGTGYGSRKHLVDHDGVHQVREGRHLRTLVPALCSSIIYLDFVDTSPEWTASHQGRSLCTKCVKAAEKTGMVL